MAPKVATPKDPVSLADIRSRMSRLEDSVVQDPSPANIENLKRKLEVLESLIAQEKSRRLASRRRRHESATSCPSITTSSSTIQPSRAHMSEHKTEDWVRPGIVVQVLAENLGEHIYQKKGYIRELVRDKFTAIVVIKDKLNPGYLLPSSEKGDEKRKKKRKEFKVKIDQSYLQTVVPEVGEKVMIVNGKHRGKRAVLQGIHKNEKCATLCDLTGENKIDVSVSFEDFSQIYID